MSKLWVIMVAAEKNNEDNGKIKKDGLALKVA